MGVHGGKFAVLNGFDTVRDWTVNDSATNPKGVASNSRMGTFRRRGVRAWTGSFNSYGPQPNVLPGEFFDFQGFLSPDNDSEGVGITYEGNAIVDQVVITWNWQTGDMISHATNFSGHMELTPGSGSYSDDTDPDADTICGTKVQFDGGDWPNVAQAVLTITAANQPYVNTDTNCWTGRKSGPIDFTLAITEQEVDRDTVPDHGDNPIIKIFTTPALFYELKWCEVENFSNIVANRETGAIESRVCNLAMNGFNPGVGWIKLPDATTWWPFASSSP